MQESKRDALVQHAALAFLDRCPFGVIVFDRSMAIVEVNKQQEVNSGIGRAKFVGQRVDQLFAEVIERHGLAEPMRKLLENGKPFDVTVERFQRTFLRDEYRGHWIGLQLAPDLFAIMTDGESKIQRSGNPRIIGSTPRMEAVFTFIERAARVNASVLVVGESGTGKELVARAIHARSDRSRQPFLALNCAALPGPLLESTLFGAEKGAFTGADRRTKGYFEAAEGGVLMLDEIGDTSLEFQVKLLRVLEEGKVTRLGGTEPIRTNARVICATNRDLEKEVAATRFRHDLFSAAGAALPHRAAGEAPSRAQAPDAGGAGHPDGLPVARERARAGQHAGGRVRDHAGRVDRARAPAGAHPRVAALVQGLVPSTDI